AGVDRCFRSDLSDSVMAERRIEVLRHRTIVAKLFGIMSNEVPARKLKAANLSQYFFSIHGLEVFLLGLVRTGTKHHLPFDCRDSSVPQANLITSIDDGSSADSRSVGQIPSRHISIASNGGVEVARRVTLKRKDSNGGVGVSRSVEKEGTGPAGCVEVTRG